METLREFTALSEQEGLDRIETLVTDDLLKLYEAGCGNNRDREGDGKCIRNDGLY